MATDTRTVEELKAAVVAGDTKITAADIEKARQTEEFVELQAQAATAQAHRDRVAALEADVEAFKAEYAELAGADLSELRDLYEDAVVVIAELHAKVKERVAEQREIEGRAGALTIRARDLGVSTGRGPLIDNSQGEWTRIAYVQKTSKALVPKRSSALCPTRVPGRPSTHCTPTSGSRTCARSTAPRTPRAPRANCSKRSSPGTTRNTVTAGWVW
ncbi:hypothetical protein ACVH9Z_34305 [Rhodococcus opacus]|uniref:hypothetical protein n=1 Tax=Rhodococcus opacus TaxID=37919 RepID=UPI001B300C5A|nr:hypothetical protein [Rhodococcus opacus]